MANFSFVNQQPLTDSSQESDPLVNLDKRARRPVVYQPLPFGMNMPRPFITQILPNILGPLSQANTDDIINAVAKSYVERLLSDALRPMSPIGR